MRASLEGRQLPENLDDFNRLKKEGKLRFEDCWRCKQPHATSHRNNGSWSWIETQITGTCGQCWDELFKTNVKVS